MPLPPALQALSEYPQFINWKAVPLGNGKINKLPVSPHTGQVCNAHDPAEHSSIEAASAAGEPLAFVFTDNDPFFFLDIDDCLQPEGTWSPAAAEMCALFTGCAVEISQSGQGLHIFGRIPPGAYPHGSNNKSIGTQFYTSKRFVALTGTNTVGSAHTMPSSDTYAAFIKKYFPLVNDVSIPTGWTDKPDPDWDGFEDDDELIACMLKTKSARGILGASATIKQLWDADENALCKIFPDTAGTRDRMFDWSSADAALCSHLAFYTGKNCERMDTLFRRSSLMRDKWNRHGYRLRTLLHATALCKEVYRKPVVKPTGFQFCTLQNQQKLFKGCCYIRDIHRIFVPDTGGLLRPDQFRAVFGGHIFTLDSLGDKTTRNAWEVYTESQAFRFPQAHSTCFRPELKPGEIVDWEGIRHVNTYIPVFTTCVQGDPSPFINLLEKLLPVPQDREILLAYMAACVQHTGTKFQWAPLLQGVEGNGKSFLGTCLTHAVGEKYTHSLDPKDIGNIFNAWVSQKLLVIVEEVQTKGNLDAVKTLGWLIANRRIPIQGKGQDQITGDNRANFLMFTNSKDAIYKTKKDRKFCIFYTAQQEASDLKTAGMEGSYFPQLYKWARAGGYAAINYYLRKYQIPDTLNPAKNCHRAPDTSSTSAVIINSLGTIEQDVLEAVASGRTGFKGGWISSMAFDQLLRELRVKIPVNKRRRVLEDLGYISHPALCNGRVNNAIPVEGGKPRLYIQKTHTIGNITKASMVTRIYQEAQGYLLEQKERIVPVG